MDGLASRATEVSKGRETYKEKGEFIGTKPDRLVVKAIGSVISWNSLSLTFLSLDILFWWCHFRLIRFAPNISKSWQLLLLRAVKPETWHTPLSWQPCFSTLITYLFMSRISSLPWSLHVPTVFTSSLSSLFYSFHSYPRPYSLHFPLSSLFISQVSSLLWSFHVPALFTFLISSFPYSLQFPSLFTAVLCSFLYSFLFHVRTLCTSLLFALFTSLVSSLPYSFHFPTFFTSLFFSLPFSLQLILSSLPFSLHFSALFTSLLPSGSLFL